MDNSIQIREDCHDMPLCPHCEKVLNTINSKKVKAGFGVRYVYSCTACRKVLGVSHRKGFWMG